MSALLIILIILAVLLIAFLLVRVRLRLEISDRRRCLFIGFGRTGPEFDFGARRGRLKMLGLPVRSFDLKRSPGEQLRRVADLAVEKESPRAGKEWSWADVWETLPRIGRGTWDYVGGLFSDLIVEEAEGRIEAGFEQPDVTGRVYGYYRAMAAALPGMASRVIYTPDWTGASFDGSLKLAVAWPMYRLIHRTAVWLFKIRIMKIIRMAIGTKEGGQHVQ